MQRIYSLFLVMVTLFAGCINKPKELTHDQMRIILEQRNELLKNYFISGDADSVASMYTQDARLCPNGGEFVIGLKNIRAFWLEDLSMSDIVEMTTAPNNINGNTKLIYETGKTYLRIKSQDGYEDLIVKYCNIWKLEPDGEYYLEVDIWNNVGVSK